LFLEKLFVVVVVVDDEQDISDKDAVLIPFPGTSISSLQALSNSTKCTKTNNMPLFWGHFLLREAVPTA
jgi:cobyric acid synthase